MHLDHFLVVIFAKRFRRDLRQVKEQIHADGKIGREDDGDLRRRGLDGLALFRGMAGRADDQRLAVVGRQLRQVGRERMMREFDQRVAAVDEIEHVVALVDAGDEFELRVLAREAHERFAHPALRADNDDPGFVRAHGCD